MTREDLVCLTSCARVSGCLSLRNACNFCKGSKCRVVMLQLMFGYGQLVDVQLVSIPVSIIG